MAKLIVRNLPDDVYQALGVRAARHGRSIEAEVCQILCTVVRPERRLRLGDAMATLVQGIGLTNEEVEALERTRDTAPAKPPRFE